MTAPTCPVSNSQVAYYRSLFRGNAGQPKPITTNSIPAAQDLPSLIRTVNVMRDVLRQLTSSLTVNNLYNSPPPFFKAEGNTYYSDYPNWDETEVETSRGYMYNRDAETHGLDKEQRALVLRQDRVHFENRTQEDPEFIWTYVKPLDGLGTGELGQVVFHEDFFERIIDVNWSAGLAVEFFDGAG